MKQKRIFIFIMLFLTVLGLSACSSGTNETKDKYIDGKYIDIANEEHYLIFNKDASFIDKNTSFSERYIYHIDKEGFITIIDATKYEFHDSLDEYELGWLYNDNIGIWLDGTLPINNTETSISCLLNGYKFEFNFNNDGTYEHTTTSTNEIVHTENGTYTVNDNEVACTSEDNVTITFINAEDKIFCVQYIKE